MVGSGGEQFCVTLSLSAMRVSLLLLESLEGHPEDNANPLTIRAMEVLSM
jgi:hypothetical protein